MKLCDVEHEMICYTSNRCPLCAKIRQIDDLEEGLFAEKTRESDFQVLSERPAFRLLNTEEEEEFREWARANRPNEDEEYPTYHPVVKDEWFKLGYKFK